MMPIPVTPQNVNVWPLYAFVRQNVPESASSILTVASAVIESSALAHSALLTAKNSVMGTSGFSPRIRAAETVSASFASSVHHFVFSSIFSLLAIATLGQITSIRQLAIKHVVQTALTVATVVTSLISVVSPQLGIETTGRLFLFIGVAIVQNIQNQMSDTVHELIRANGPALRNALLQSVNNDEGLHALRVQPLISHLEQRVAPGPMRTPFIDTLKSTYQRDPQMVWAYAASGARGLGIDLENNAVTNWLRAQMGAQMASMLMNRL